MTRFAAPRARLLLAATALLFVAASAGLRSQTVAAPPPVPWPTPPPGGLFYVLTSDNPSAMLRIEPAEVAATR
jgi:hypothetical protein